MEILYILLDKLLLGRKTRLDRFDGNYLDDFHFIMNENYNINNCKKGQNEIFDNILKILNEKYGYNITEDMKTEKISEILIKIIENKQRYTPHHSSEQTHKNHSYNTVKDWEKLKNKTDINSILSIQKGYSIQSGKKSPGTQASHFNGRYSKQKQDFFKTLRSNSMVISIGNRWKDEIVYIRNHFKLPNTIGLDLFSEDINFVKVGDIHNTSFPDNTFDVIYQKNTFNKLYDLRKALTECIRILKPGGVLISDDCYDYSIGVNPLARTNVTTNKWYFSYMKNNIDSILIDIEEKPKEPGTLAWLRNTGLFAIKIKKD